jgi:hypothetical protein
MYLIRGFRVKINELVEVLTKCGYLQILQCIYFSDIHNYENGGVFKTEVISDKLHVLR